MFAAKSGHSTLGIPKDVGEEFTEDLAPGSVSALPQKVKGPSSSLEATTGIPSGKRTHRGRRSRGNGGSVNAHTEAKGHLMNAHNASTPKASMAHLFKALSSLKKAT
jgi:hypothetical protein